MTNLIRLMALSGNGASIACPSDTPGGTGTCSTGLPQVSAHSSVIQNALAIFFGVAAGIAVLMIIIGAFMFITSAGNPEKAGKARETIIYAAVGLIVSLSALTLVEFILGKL